MIPTREQIVSWSNMAVAWSYEKGVVETPDISRVGLVNERLVLYRGEVDNAANWFSSMRAEIDRLKTYNATALNERSKWENEAAQLRADLDRANIEAALARDALAKATAPAPEREAKIEAWVEGALAHQSDDGSFPMWKYEIDDAVALMRSAGDGKALLRELRAWIIDERWVAGGIVRKIDEMLAKPAPVEQPAAAVPENHDEGRMCMLCCGYVPSGSKFAHGVGVCVPEPVPVTKPAAAEPDDTRELVAQLGHFVCMMLKGEANRAEVRGIMAKLRGGA